MARKKSSSATTPRRAPASPAKQNSARRSPVHRSAANSKARASGPESIVPNPESDLFHILMGNTTDRIYFKDRESRFILINQSVAAEMGLNDPAEAVGKTDFDFFSEEHARQAYTDEQQIIAGGPPKVGIEEKETWPDGHETWVSTTKLPIRDRQGRIIGTFGISRDITEHKRGEAAQIAAAVLRESNLALEKTNTALQDEIAERRRVEQALSHERELFRTMMDNTFDHIYFKDTESRFLRINRAQAAAFGLSDPDDAVGKTDHDFFSEEHARQAQADEKKILTSDQPFMGLEEKETWPDGRQTWVSSMKLPLRDQEGRIIGTFGISRDITERKAIEFSILETNRELEKTNATLKVEIAERLRAETALAFERDLFRTMMDNTSDHIYFKDSESRFILMNRALARTFGLADPTLAIGKTDFDFFTEEHARQAFNDEKQIMVNGKPLVGVEEKETWPGGRETWVSSTKIPMRDQTGRIIGTFGISRDITESKSMELSIELANTKLADMVNWLEGRNREINVLNEMGKLLEACRSREEAYPVISGQMEKLIPVHSGALFLLNGEAGRLEAAASWGEDPNPAEPFAPQDCWGIQNGGLYVVNTTHPGKYCRHIKTGSGKEPACLCIPLIAQGETMGLLTLENQQPRGGSETLPESKLQLAVIAADHIALALANLTLRETLRVQSIRDALTGLFNRRYLEESLLRELARAKRKTTALGVVMLDVDHLKLVNDSFGHEAGDTLLHSIGEWLHANTRAEDISCRYGGDEFVLILPDATLESTRLRAEQICEGIRHLRIFHHEQSLGAATVSVGIAAYPEHGQTRDALLAAADSALYKAKSGGRNSVVVAAEKKPPSPAER
jgi:diguanylate cyclase (GGDEF)-like protein/PAS domain S-box-containing protein